MARATADEGGGSPSPQMKCADKRKILHDRATGELIEVERFVAVLGASNYTFAEATRSQQLADFVGSTVGAFE